MNFRIEPAAPSDWATIRDICCRTGNSGSPIDRARWRFFAEYWVGPYEKLRPDWCWVARTPEGRVAAYLTGCPDSRRFEKERLARFYLPLFFRSVLLRQFDWNDDVRRFCRRLLKRDKGPEDCLTTEIRRLLAERFPAHLHINADAEFRKGGVGRRLIDAYLVRLKEAGIPGVHLLCGPAPVGFYEKTGFAELARVEFRPGLFIYVMGKKIT